MLSDGFSKCLAKRHSGQASAVEINPLTGEGGSL